MLEYRVFKATTAKNLIDLAGHLFMLMWKRELVRFGDFQPIASDDLGQLFSQSSKRVTR